MVKIVKLDRRQFLHISATSGGGLILAAYLPACGDGNGSGPATDAAPASDAASTDAALPQEYVEPSVYLRIASDGSITVFVSRTEMGQSVRTAVAMLAAEELDADWTGVTCEGVVAADKYGEMTTGGSYSVRYCWDRLRRAGATARAMLIEAAAQSWGVDSSACSTDSGEVVLDATGDRLAYGDLVDVAKDLPVPSSVALKNEAEFRIVGSSRGRLDAAGKLDGSALFGMDVRVDGMRYAVIARPPTVGGSVAGFVPDAALAVAGVRQVVEVGSGVAVIADNSWAALKGRDALAVTFAPGPNATLDDAGLQAILDTKALETPQQARMIGDPTSALATAAIRLDATYHVPFAAHAPMEPMNCLAHVNGDTCKVWAPSQTPIQARNALATKLGISATSVEVRTTLVGGGFGSRFRTDHILEAAEVSQAAGAPVQVFWPREDDLRHAYHRPFSRHLLSGGLDASNDLDALSHVVVAPSVRSQFSGNDLGLDEGAVDGVMNSLYAIPNFYAGYVKANTPIPLVWWRSVYLSQNPFAHECFLDELAEAAGRNPLEFRLALLGSAPRLAAVLDRAATEAGWGGSLPVGHGHGIACARAYDSFIAMVAEVSVAGDGAVIVHKMTCAVDCGRVVDPDNVAAQMEGGVAFGLSAALWGELNVAGGAIQQSNYHDYRILRCTEMPAVDVHIIASTSNPGGIGELPIPVVAPALANALYAATGTRIRSLPIGPRA